MKITKKQLRRIINEEHAKLLREDKKRRLAEQCSAKPLEKKSQEGEVYGSGGSARMVKSQLFQIAKDASALQDMLSEKDELPEWVQSKIAVIEDSLDAVFDHLEFKHREHHGGKSLDFTGDVGELPSDEAFAIGYTAGAEGL